MKGSGEVSGITLKNIRFSVWTSSFFFGRESRNVNEIFYGNEARRIAELNEIFGEVELTAVEKRTLIWLAADKAKKQADKYQKRMNELAPMEKNMERLAAEFSANPEETLPEVAVMESVKSYREKKAKPLVEKMVKVLKVCLFCFFGYFPQIRTVRRSIRQRESWKEEIKRTTSRSAG